jgi:hypothetical protein
MDSSENVSHIDNTQISVNYLYDEPIIITHPKREWHYRSIKDLAKKHIPFISGDGPQRTPIRLKVSFDRFHKYLSNIK